jgi:hypothetical protein
VQGADQHRHGALVGDAAQADGRGDARLVDILALERFIYILDSIPECGCRASDEQPARQSAREQGPWRREWLLARAGRKIQVVFLEGQLITADRL